MPDYKETLVRIDHEAGTAEVWTEDRRTKTLLGKRKFKFTREQAKGAWYMGASTQVRFCLPKRSSAPLNSSNAGVKKRGMSAGLAAYQAKRRAAKAAAETES